MGLIARPVTIDGAGNERGESDDAAEQSLDGSHDFSFARGGRTDDFKQEDRADQEFDATITLRNILHGD